MPRPSAYLFYPCSRSAEDQLNALFDFVWPTAIAMWNLRWQLKGFIAEHPDATHLEISQRFISSQRINPPHKLNWANLSESQAGAWEDQTRQLARIVLINAFAVYEAFLEDLCKEVGLSGYENEHLQFPVSAPKVDRSGSHSYQDVLSSLALTPSPIITSELYPGLVGGRNNNLANLEPMMVCYRCFKEMRNAVIHGGGKVSSVYRRDAINTFVHACSPLQLGISHMTPPQVVAIGDMVQLELPFVVAFTAVLRKLIATLDAEFAKHLRAEDSLVEQWRAIFEPNVLLKLDIGRRHRQLRNRLHTMGLPEPQISTALDTLLQQKGAYQCVF
jgi:hypothetical protein